VIAGIDAIAADRNGFERLPIELIEHILLDVGLAVGLSETTRGNWFVKITTLLSAVCRLWRLIVRCDIYEQALKRRFFESGTQSFRQLPVLEPNEKVRLTTSIGSRSSTSLSFLT
jgi:hypothetical protein